MTMMHADDEENDGDGDDDTDGNHENDGDDIGDVDDDKRLIVNDGGDMQQVVMMQ